MADILASTPCPDCGAMVYADARFCQACGIKLTGSAVTVSRLPILERLSGAFEQVCDAAAEIVNDPQNRKTAKDFVVGTAENAGGIAKDVLTNPVTRKVAGGAVIGAGVASILPVVTLTAGAVAGAALIGYKLLTSDKE